MRCAHLRLLSCPKVLYTSGIETSTAAEASWDAPLPALDAETRSNAGAAALVGTHLFLHQMLELEEVLLQQWQAGLV